MSSNKAEFDKLNPLAFLKYLSLMSSNNKSLDKQKLLCYDGVHGFLQKRSFVMTALLPNQFWNVCIIYAMVVNKKCVERGWKFG